mmetsp:Transcript_17960/g.34565  ORF Transcript_17960/g.34565 Transcript_17960/m.34565 type:complete len:116 (-) Transcript_17960:147-494(-)
MSVWHETRVALDALQDVTNAPLKFETSLDLTYVQHWESVGEKSTQTCMTKSPDKHNSTAIISSTSLTACSRSWSLEPSTLVSQCSRSTQFQVRLRLQAGQHLVMGPRVQQASFSC